MRMSSQEALLSSRGGNGSQLLGEPGNQHLQQQQQLPPPPPEPWTQQQQTRGSFAGIMGGTLGRHAPMIVGGQGPTVPNVQQYPSTFRGGSYPLYHTCERPSSKKRVTIVEDNNTESSV